MFESLLKALTGADHPAPLPDPDARRALAALMVRVARADLDFDESEEARIKGLLATHYELSDQAAGELLSEAETLEAEAPDTVRFTRALKDAVAYEERAWVMEALWSVALADGTRDHEEDALMRLVASLLGLSDRDSALARQRVAGRAD
ncbi:hypothetical protein C2I36_07240 [Rhodobacteraceae bacterium WD3A24]|nr:hypothetical protein C2I36_07240 [Rhodobacteraceae bacterium WD3A24]